MRAVGPRSRVGPGGGPGGFPPAWAGAPGAGRSRGNPLGGAIALGHPLGATGAIRTGTLLLGLRRRGKKYGMVTMCIGTGMGAAGLFEALA